MKIRFSRGSLELQETIEVIMNALGDELGGMFIDAAVCSVVPFVTVLEVLPVYHLKLANWEIEPIKSAGTAMRVAFICS
jgi:hypothetical protein